MQNRKKAAGRQRATSTDQVEREFSRVVARAEPCGEGLRADGMTNGAGTSARSVGYRAMLRLKLLRLAASSERTGAILTVFSSRRFWITPALNCFKPKPVSRRCYSVVPSL